MSISIGPVTLDAPVILAPLSGISDLPFRRLVKRWGAGMVVSEMIASQAMIRETRQSLLMARGEPEQFPMAVQLAGCEPAVMAEAARLNEDRGASLIDINFGCPVKKVVNGHAGSSLMRDELLAARILEATARAVKIPVTLKMRMGWDQSSLNAPKLARIAQESGIRMVTIHGRTRCQFYEGTADWGFVRRVKEAVAIPATALSQFAGAEKVWKLVEGIAREAEIVSGSRRDGMVEITQGLVVGDVILADASIGKVAKILTPKSATAAAPEAAATPATTATPASGIGALVEKQGN